jgi:NAD-dependent DNA ligase
MQAQIPSTSTSSPLFLEKIPAFTQLIKNKKICFTGKFSYGTREMCQAIAKDKGATISSSVTQDLDILIIGKLGSPHWKYFSYGRKIEKAIIYNNKGKEIILLPEVTWIENLENLEN